MRIVCLLIGSVLSTGAAQASSFLVLAPMKDNVGPSIVILGEPRPVAASRPFAPVPVAEAPLSYPYPEESPTVVLAPIEPEPFVVSASIVAMGTPAISYDKVAAIGGAGPRPTPRPPFSMPVVMRGGIVGDAFPDSQAPSLEGESPAAASSPEDAASGQASRRPDAPRQPEQPAPPPAAVAPAPATRAPE
ncbi:MAG: hypothetical protein AB7I79_08005 [Rhizobiaceae bacterium]